MSDPLMMCYECEWVGPQEQAVWRAETWPLCPACYAQVRENEVFEMPVHLADAWRVRERAEAELAAEVAREAIDEGDYLRRRLLERILHPEEEKADAR